MSELYAIADFCLIPIGKGSTSVAEEVAECQRVLEKSGLEYQMHGYGTNLEGPWSKVMTAIHDCHQVLHKKGILRIATDIRIGTRTDREIEPGKGNQHKVQRVKELLALDANKIVEGNRLDRAEELLASATSLAQAKFL